MKLKEIFPWYKRIKNLEEENEELKKENERLKKEIEELKGKVKEAPKPPPTKGKLERKPKEKKKGR